MNISMLRGLDRVVGVPACVLLTLHRRLFRRARAGGPIRRILFVKLAEQGSTVLASDALQAAVERVGRENVFFLVFDENRFILDAMDIIPGANVVALDVRTAARALRSIPAAIRRLRKARIDAAIDLEFFARSSAIFSYLSGARHRVGLHSYAGEGPYRGDLMTHRLVYNPYLHTAQLFLLMIRALDHDDGLFPAFAALPPEVRSDPPRCRPLPAEVAEVRQLLFGATGLSAVPPLVLLNANCSDLMPLRRWDSSRYVGLARRLLDARPEVSVAFTGSPEEAGEIERLVSEVSSARCISLAGKTTLDQLLALYSLSEVLVTNDSGPAHFAAMTQIDVVTLFGPETPALFAARTPRNHVLWSGVACSPCVSALNNRLSRCRDNLCMQRLTLDDVFDTTLKIYAARAATAVSRRPVDLDGPRVQG